MRIYRWFSLLVLVSLFFSGCASVQNQDQSLNEGAISGTVYLVDELSWPTGIFPKAQSASVIVGDVSITSASDGSFNITGIPSGTVCITATKDGYYPTAIVTNKNSVAIYLQMKDFDDAAQQGVNTLSGKVSGVNPGDNINSISARSLNGQYAQGFFDSINQTYSIANAPDSGTTYISANKYLNGHYYLAYTRIDPAATKDNINISFENGKTINGTLAYSQNFNSFYIYGTVFRGNQIMASMWGENLSPGSKSFTVNLPGNLFVDDSYGISISASTTNEGGVRKFLYNVNSDTPLNVDLDSIPSLNLSDTCPVEGAVVTEYPTISWDAVAGANTYNIWIFDNTNYQTVLSIFTTDTSVQIPACIKLEPGIKYEWSVCANFARGFTAENIYGDFFNMYLDQYSYSPYRNFYYQSANLANGVNSQISGKKPKPIKWFAD